jgi:dTDP-4-dehydrorhamnose reductase
MHTKKNVLVLGHKGMLGNLLVRYFGNHDRYTVTTIEGHWDSASFKDAIMNANADIIINAIGSIPQKKPTDEQYTSVNYELPLYLDTLGKKVLHPSTDCEFLGNIAYPSHYTKSSPRDADDAYGISKAKASEWIEHQGKNTKIIRTSIIGHELTSSLALLDWFLHAEGEVRGFTNHYWNGMTTLQWATIAEDIMDNWDTYPVLNQYGTTPPVSKYDLLMLVKQCYAKDIVISPFATEKDVNKLLTTDKEIPSLQEQLLALKAFYRK